VVRGLRQLLCAVVFAATVETGLAATTGSLLGTSSPPAVAGGQPLLAFSTDPALEFASVTTVPSPSGLDLSFDQSMEHLVVGYSWYNWGQGYFGDVYATDATSFSLTITLPADTTRFVFYAMPSDLVIQQFTVSETSSGSPLLESIDGNGDAAGFLFVADPGSTLNQIFITSTGSFAVGEFLLTSIPEASTGGVGAVLVFLTATRLRRGRCL
jgi:hypothetical protein